MTGPAFPRRALLAAALTVLIAGCASTSPDAPRPPLLTDDGGSGRLHLAGRFSMTANERIPEERHSSASGLFVVERSAEGLMMTLSSPLGQTIARASHRSGEAAELVTQQGERFTGASLDDVFARAIGIRVPAERLPAWLEGRFAQVLERSPDGSRLRAVDEGWQIERTGQRWTLVFDQGGRRIEVRLFADGS